MNIIQRLLRKNLSMAQLVGFTLANFIGLLIVLLGLQFYTDVHSIWQDEDSFMQKDYLVINKRINELDGVSDGFGNLHSAHYGAERLEKKS